MSADDPQALDPAAALAEARALRAAGDVDGARRRLTEALEVAALRAPATVELAAGAGWLQLELAHLHAVAAEIEPGLAAVDVALGLFERAGEGAGAAAAWLVRGDLAWAVGESAAAVGAWSQARSLADAVGAAPLAARALVALAVREVMGGEAGVAEALLTAAGERAQLDAGLAAAAADHAQVARAQADAVRASLALVQVRRALAGRRWREARLLLEATVAASRPLQEPELYAEALRLDAALARKLGDAAAAVESLRLAKAATRTAATAALVQAELVLALADAGHLAEAGQALGEALPAELEQLPAVQAARGEAFAVLALRSGERQAGLTALAQVAELRRGHGDVLGAVRARLLAAEVTGEVDEAMAARDEALRLGRDDLAAQAVLVQARAAVAQALPEAARAAEIAVRAAAAHGGVALQVAALDVLAAAELQAGQAHFARQVLAQALALAHAHPDHRLRARVEARLAQVALTEGEPRQALVLASSAHESCDDTDARLRCLAVTGRALAALGRADEAVLALERALIDARQLVAHGWVAELAFELGNVHTVGQQAAAARVAFATAIDAAAAAGQAWLGLRSQRGLAWSLRRLGASDAADRTLADASRTAAELKLAGEWVAAEVLRAQWALDAGELQSAVDHLAGLPLQDDAALPPAVLGDALTLRGRVWAQGGRLDEARDDLERAVTVLREAGDPRSLGAALLLAGQVAGLRGEGELCGRQLAEALLITARHGLPEQEVVRQVIARLEQQAKDAG